MIDYFIFLLYKSFKFIVLLMPKFLVKLFLDGLTNFINLIDLEHKKYAKANLNLVYGNNISDKEKNNIIKESYRNLVYNLYEFIENPTLNLEQLEKKITVKNENIILDAIKNDRKIILISAHYGNWEYITSYISLKYRPTTMVGKLMKNKYLNNDMENNRNKHNSQMLSKYGSAKGLMKALKTGRMIGLAIDQHVFIGKGVKVNFLGYNDTQTDSTSRLAIKNDALIIPVYFIKDDFRKYTIKFDTPIDHKNIEDNEDKVIKLTQLQADSMSKQILEYPEIWFWQHKRWKEYYGDIYKK